MLNMSFLKNSKKKAAAERNYTQDSPFGEKHTSVSSLPAAAFFCFCLSASVHLSLFIFYLTPSSPPWTPHTFFQ